jgi:tetratricopeptide (TPR) repeat protein
MATVDLQRGRLKMVQAQLPSFSGQVGALAAQSRASLLRASSEYEKAFKLLSEARDKLPLPVEDDRSAAKLRKDRSRLFNRMIDARFQAAYSLFLVAESYRTITPPKGMVEGKDPIQSRDKQLEYLKQAEDRFAEIVTEYRQWLVAPVARVWQARCIAARGDHRRAKGIFEEITLDKDRRLAHVHRQAFYFDLLSAAAQEDYGTLAAKAEAWLRDSKARRTSEYLGVQLELAKAYMALAEKAEADARKQDLYRKADGLLEQVGKTPNEHQGLARREQLKLEGLLAKDGSGKTYQQFASRGRAVLDNLSPTATPAERAATLEKARELFKQAIAAAGPEEDAHDARLQLMYCLFSLEDYAGAAALGEAELKDHGKGPGAGQAVSIALAAYAKLVDEAAKAGTGGDEASNKLSALAKAAIAKWPAQGPGDEARIALAHLEAHPRRKNYAGATEMLDAVAPTSPRYGEAASIAGQTYLEWSRGLAGDASQRAKAAQLKATAKERLAKASVALHAAQAGKIDKTMLLTDAVLAETLLEEKPQEAWKLLSAYLPAFEANTLPAQIEPPLRLATLLVALQATIQTGDVEAADKLQELVGKQQGQESAAGVTQVFTMLARKMRERLDRYVAEGNEEAGRKLEESYQSFIQRLASRESGQNAQSLAFLGMSLVEAGRYDLAQQLLDKAIATAGDKPEDQPFALAAQVGKAQCLAGKGEFNGALAAVDAVLAKQPNSQEALMARGKILMQAKRLPEAERHWDRLVRATSRSRPPAFYEAVHQLVETMKLREGAARAEGLKRAKAYLNAVLGGSDSRMPAEWREKLTRQRDGLE